MRSSETDICEQVRSLAGRALAVADQTAVMVVSNLQDRASLSTVFDRRSEYFTETEVEQLVSGFRRAGFYCDLFVGERAFMEWVAGGGIRRFPVETVLVYNTAQSGTGAGRKSLIPAFCALEGVRTLNADAYAVSLARHKFHVQSILRSAGVAVPSTWWYFGGGDWLNEDQPAPGERVIAKSSFESASIGMSPESSFVIGPDANQVLDSIAEALRQPVVVQAFVSGHEAETPVLVFDQVMALPPVGVSVGDRRLLGDQFLDFEHVANDNYGFYALASELPGTTDAVMRSAVQTARTLNLRGFCRVDCRIDCHGRSFVTDVSTTPHLTAHSSFAFAFDRLGFDQSEMLATLAGGALSR